MSRIQNLAFGFHGYRVGFVVVLVGLAALSLLAGCAAPVGTDATNPTCLIRCNVSYYEVRGNPALATLNTTGSATGGAVSRSRQTTITDNTSEE